MVYPVERPRHRYRVRSNTPRQNHSERATRNTRTECASAWNNAFLYETQTAEGGFPYGRDFEQYPDVDDTSRALVFLQKMHPLTNRKGAAESRKSRKKGLHGLLKRQNSDGGPGAFDQDNIGSRVAKLFTKDLTDSVELFDGSSADNTGHVLAGLGAYGLTAKHPDPSGGLSAFCIGLRIPARVFGKAAGASTPCTAPPRPEPGFCGQVNRRNRLISAWPPGR
jgi:hypothetical protein